MRLSNVSWIVACAAIVSGCASEGKEPFTGVLHPSDSGTTDAGDGSMPGLDAAGVSDASTVDAGVDAAVDGAVDSGTDAALPSPVEGFEPSNMPNALVEYGGSELVPGLTFLGTHLDLDDYGSGSALSLDFYARVRNDFNETLCAFSVRVDLFDSNGLQLARRLSTLADLAPFNSSSGLSGCVSPGGVFYIYATDFIDFGGGTVSLEDVALVEWTYSLGGYLAAYTPATRASISNLAVSPSDFDSFVLTGRVTNGTSTPLAFPSVVAYVLNQGNQPLHRLIDITSTSISAFGTWDFETGRYYSEFSPLDIDYIITYQ